MNIVILTLLWVHTQTLFKYIFCSMAPIALSISTWKEGLDGDLGALYANIYMGIH